MNMQVHRAAWIRLAVVFSSAIGAVACSAPTDSVSGSSSAISAVVDDVIDAAAIAGCLTTYVECVRAGTEASSCKGDLHACLPPPPRDHGPGPMGSGSCAPPDGDATPPPPIGAGSSDDPPPPPPGDPALPPPDDDGGARPEPPCMQALDTCAAGSDTTATCVDAATTCFATRPPPPPAHP